MTTTEDLYGMRPADSPQQRADLSKDVLVPKGTRLLSCKHLGDRWIIVVRVGGKHTELITFRNPLGTTLGERLGPSFACYTPVTLKRSQFGIPKGARGVIEGIEALDSFRVRFGDKVITVGHEFLGLNRQLPG